MKRHDSRDNERPFNVKKIPLNLFLMGLGSVLCAMAINGILVPKGFYGAGLTGIALLVHYALPAFSVAVVYLILMVS